MINEALVKKLRKIATLAEQGYGGEKESAKNMLDYMLRKYGVNIDDILERRKEREFRTNNKSERQLLVQIIRTRLTWDHRVYKTRGKPKYTYTELTDVEYADIYDRYMTFRKAYKKETDNLFIAFVNKNNLIPTDYPKESCDKGFSASELTDIARKMAEMEYTVYQRKINGEEVETLKLDS